MSKNHRRSVAGFAAAALGLSGAIVATGAPTLALADETVAPAACTADTNAKIYSFNDFHGNIQNAAKLFSNVENARAELGEDNVLLTSNGDSIGGSVFVSAILDDVPTLQVLDAIGTDMSSVGNHEFDKGYDKLKEVMADLDMPYVGANVRQGGSVAEGLRESVTREIGNGVKVGFIGGVTDDLPSLVSPAGIAGLTITDPVDEANRVAKQLKESGVDVVVVSIHEGAPAGSASAEAAAAASSKFAAMYNDLSEDVDIVFNGHTHTPYNWQTSKGQILMQADAGGSSLAEVTLGINSATGEICESETAHVKPLEEAVDTPRIQEVQRIVAAAQEEASKIGSEVIGNATEAISTPGNGTASTRDQESPMSNMVAQMFYDVLGNGDTEFIGIQNPGGTRDSFAAGEITIEDAAKVLPFANSLYTTKITGAQFKKVLEQQWQRNAAGEVPSRPYLALGLSDNVSYTYDESRDEGDRITGIFVNGAPIDHDKLYTVGSGSFLISGGDNFHELAKGVETRDSGQVDLEAWTTWVEDQGNLSPDYTKRGVSLTPADAVLTAGTNPVTFTLGKAGEVNPGTLDMFLDAEGDKVSPQLMNSKVTVHLGDKEVGKGTVAEGVGTADVIIPVCSVEKEGTHVLKFVVEDSGTEVLSTVTVKPGDRSGCGDKDKPGKPKPGLPKTGV